MNPEPMAGVATTDLQIDPESCTVGAPKAKKAKKAKPEPKAEVKT